MIPKILKNFSVFVDGRDHAGKVGEIALPKLTIKIEEHRAGGMEIPVEIGSVHNLAEVVIPVIWPTEVRAAPTISTSGVLHTQGGSLPSTQSSALSWQELDQASTEGGG